MGEETSVYCSKCGGGDGRWRGIFAQIADRHFAAAAAPPSVSMMGASAATTLGGGGAAIPAYAGYCRCATRRVRGFLGCAFLAWGYRQRGDGCGSRLDLDPADFSDGLARIHWRVPSETKT